jgi:hypothetical protein
MRSHLFCLLFIATLAFILSCDTLVMDASPSPFVSSELPSSVVASASPEKKQVRNTLPTLKSDRLEEKKMTCLNESVDAAVTLKMKGPWIHGTMTKLYDDYLSKDGALQKADFSYDKFKRRVDNKFVVLINEASESNGAPEGNPSELSPAFYSPAASSNNQQQQQQQHSLPGTPADDGIALSLALDSRNRGGRTIGSTEANKEKQEQELADCKNWIVRSIIEDREKSSLDSTKMNLSVEKWIQRGIIHCGLDANTSISRTTINSRIQVGNIDGRSSGPALLVPPDVEDLFVEYCNANYVVGFPIPHSDFLIFANASLKETTTEKEILERKRLNNSETNCGDLLGSTWLKGFLSRHDKELGSRFPEVQDERRWDWTTYTNMKQMYDDVDKAILLGNLGKTIEGLTVASMERVKIDALSGHYFAFGDETGANTDQSDDKHVKLPW